ncbi:MAG: hypothetical protein QXN05_04655 [Acidilobaceae archaeon]
MYFFDWPPLREILIRALPQSFHKFDLSSLAVCKLSSLILVLRGDDEFKAVKPMFEKCDFDVVLNMSHVSASLSRLIHKLVLKNEENYLEAQVLRSPRGDVVLVSGDLKLHQTLEKALKAVSSAVVTVSLPPSSLVVLKWLLASFFEELLKLEELIRATEDFGIKRQLIERLLREIGFEAQDFNSP